MIKNLIIDNKHPNTFIREMPFHCTIYNNNAAKRIESDFMVIAM
jgi:hypothetical protein